MSKTKMNGVDPIDVFDKFGVDATRLTLAQVGSTDIRWNEKAGRVVSQLRQQDLERGALLFTQLGRRGSKTGDTRAEHRASRSLDRLRG